MIICDHCKGNGYVKVRFEAEQAIEQCKVCDSQGTLLQNKHYHQSWTEGEEDSPVVYYGRPLDPESFKNYKIYAG